MVNKYESNQSNYKASKQTHLDYLAKSVQGLKGRLNSESRDPFTKKIVMGMR